MYRNFTRLEYAGYVLEKKGKSDWVLRDDGRIVAFATTLNTIKKFADKRKETK